MGANNGLKPKNRILRGTYRQLKVYCKSKNIADKFIHKDEKGYYLKTLSRFNFK